MIKQNNQERHHQPQQSKNIKDTSLHLLIMEKNTTCRSKISWRRSCKVSLVTGLISCPLGDNLGDVILTRKLQVPENKKGLQFLVMVIEHLVCNPCLHRIYIRQNHCCVRCCHTPPKDSSFWGSPRVFQGMYSEILDEFWTEMFNLSSLSWIVCGIAQSNEQNSTSPLLQS